MAAFHSVIESAISAIDAASPTNAANLPLPNLNESLKSLRKALTPSPTLLDAQSLALSSDVHVKVVNLIVSLCGQSQPNNDDDGGDDNSNSDSNTDSSITSLTSCLTTSCSILCNIFTSVPQATLSLYLNEGNSFFSKGWESALLAIMCELKCGETAKRKMVARLIASIYNAMHSLPPVSAHIHTNSNLIGNIIRMSLPTTSIKDSPPADAAQDDCTDWSVRLLTHLLSPYDSPYPSIHRSLSSSVITGEHVVLLNAFGGVVDDKLLSSGFGGETPLHPTPFNPEIIEFFSNLLMSPTDDDNQSSLIDMSAKFQFLLIDIYGSLLSLHPSYPPLAPSAVTTLATNLLSAASDPVKQKNLLKLLSSLLYSQHSRSSLGREGIYAILNATETCKVLGGREYAVACIQSAVKDDENRLIVEELRAQEVKPNGWMEKMGLDVKVSNDGKVNVTKKNS